MTHLQKLIALTFLTILALFAYTYYFTRSPRALPASPNFTVSELCPDGKTAKTEVSGDGIKTRFSERHFFCPVEATPIEDWPVVDGQDKG